MQPPFRIEETALLLLNGSIAEHPIELEPLVEKLDGCLRDGVPIVVIDAVGTEIGRITAKHGAQFVVSLDSRNPPPAGDARDLPSRR